MAYFEEILYVLVLELHPGSVGEAGMKPVVTAPSSTELVAGMTQDSEPQGDSDPTSVDGVGLQISTSTSILNGSEAQDPIGTIEDLEQPASSDFQSVGNVLSAHFNGSRYQDIGSESKQQGSLASEQPGNSDFTLQEEVTDAAPILEHIESLQNMPLSIEDSEQPGNSDFTLLEAPSEFPNVSSIDPHISGGSQTPNTIVSVSEQPGDSDFPSLEPASSQATIEDLSNYIGANATNAQPLDSEQSASSDPTLSKA